MLIHSFVLVLALASQLPETEPTPSPTPTSNSHTLSVGWSSVRLALPRLFNTATTTFSSDALLSTQRNVRSSMQSNAIFFTNEHTRFTDGEWSMKSVGGNRFGFAVGARYARLTSTKPYYAAPALNVSSKRKDQLLLLEFIGRIGNPSGPSGAIKFVGGASSKTHQWTLIVPPETTAGPLLKTSSWHDIGGVGADFFLPIQRFALRGSGLYLRSINGGVAGQQTITDAQASWKSPAHLGPIGLGVSVGTRRHWLPNGVLAMENLYWVSLQFSLPR